MAWSQEFSADSLLIWADNVFVLASSAETLQTRLNDIEAAFGALRLSFSSDSLEVLANPHVPEHPPFRLHGSGQEFSLVPSMRVLGVRLDSVASTSTQVSFRLAEAQKVYGRLRPLLGCRRIPAPERIFRFYQAVGASAVFGAGLWTLGRTTRQQIEAQELRWLRCMGHVRKGEDEPWIPFYRRRRREAERLRRLNGFETIWHRACSAVHGWAGHLQRHPTSPPARAAGWRDDTWWRATQAMGAALDFANTTSWRHPTTNWRRASWTPLWDCFGPEWQTRATDRELWFRCRHRFHEWCASRYGGTPPDRRAPKRRRPPAADVRRVRPRAQ